MRPPLRHRAVLAALMLLAGCVAFPEPNPNPIGGGGGAGSTAAAPQAQPVLSSGVIHRVQSGETVYSVAERYRVPVRSVIELNRLQPPYRLIRGQPLLLPKPREHRVAAGDTVYGISRRYGVDMSALVNLNGIVPPYTIKVGQTLRLPAPVETVGVAVATATPAPSPAIAPTPPPSPTPDPLTRVPVPVTPAGKSGIQVEELPVVGAPTPVTPPAGAPIPPTPASPPPPVATAPLPAPATAAPPPSAVPAPKPPAQVAGIVPEPAPRAASRFLWPLEGKVLSSFGPKKGGLHNDGINIAAPRGTPVRAAENGVVAYAGNELRGFGNLLLIKHADGWTSAYAHNEELLVRRGDQVKRGQVIAKVGSSGSVTSPQLHFELRQGARAVDPVKLLAQAQAGL
ncbi:MAG TPA: LysM peptidoglycan-binding domain-containing M23 family metallopeptidase [Alphaproteobacteria bacterium]